MFNLEDIVVWNGIILPFKLAWVMARQDDLIIEASREEILQYQTTQAQHP